MGHCRLYDSMYISGVARGGAGPRAQALEGAPAQLQRRSQVSLAGGGGLTEFQGGGINLNTYSYHSI